jgi:hypothetical protein
MAMAEGHHSEGLPDDAHSDFDGGEREPVHILAVGDVGGAAKLKRPLIRGD